MVVLPVVLDVEWPTLRVKAQTSSLQYSGGEVGCTYRRQLGVECLQGKAENESRRDVSTGGSIARMGEEKTELWKGKSIVAYGRHTRFKSRFSCPVELVVKGPRNCKKKIVYDLITIKYFKRVRVVAKKGRGGHHRSDDLLITIEIKKRKVLADKKYSQNKIPVYCIGRL